MTRQVADVTAMANTGTLSGWCAERSMLTQWHRFHDGTVMSE